MGRKAKLTPEQIKHYRDKHVEGESIRSLAKKANVSEALLRSYISDSAQKIKSVANQIVATEIALKSLTISAQIAAQDRAARIQRMRANLESGMEMLSGNFMRLAFMSQTELSKVDESALREDASSERLKTVSRLTAMANASVEVPMRMAATLAQAEGAGDEKVEIRGGMPD